MKMILTAALLCSIHAHASQPAEIFGSEFRAPQIDGSGNVHNPEQGEIILDTNSNATGTFKGYAGSTAGWVTFGSPTTRTVYGEFTQTGATTVTEDVDGGYSVTCSANGVCAVSFDTAFSNSPACVAQLAENINDTNCRSHTVSTTGVTINCVDTNTANGVNRRRSFVCTGPN